MVPWVSQQCVIVVLSGHTHLIFLFSNINEYGQEILNIILHDLKIDDEYNLPFQNGLHI